VTKPKPPEDTPPHLHSLQELRSAVNACRRCGRWEHATQGVPGEGAAHAPLMLVGEVPGDAEDLAGHPFVGPAGALLDRALVEAGLERTETYVSNAVKHFGFELRGKRRLHMKPSISEIKACSVWLAEELRLVKPRLVVALGSTAARALLGKAVTITSLRARALALPPPSSAHAWVTVHPSFLLRMPDENTRHEEQRRFIEDLRRAAAWLREH